MSNESNSVQNSKIRISVAMCVYGKTPYIAQQIKSILQQSERVDEIVILNDGVEAEYLEAFNDLIEEHKDIISYFENPERKGLIKNFEAALSRCRGEFIFLSDQDDIWKPEKVERVVARFEQDSSLDVVFTDALLVDENGRASGGTLWNQMEFDVDKTGDKNSLFPRLMQSNVATGATMGLRASAREHLLPLPDLVPTHLHDGWIALASATSGKIGWVNKPLISYRLHAAQVSGVSPEGVSLYWRKFQDNFSVQKHAHMALKKDVVEDWKKTLACLIDRGLVTKDQQQTIQEKIEFLEYRASVNDRKFTFRNLKNHWRSRSYHRFTSRPFRSLLLDIFSLGK